jgi:hypothetical protein
MNLNQTAAHAGEMRPPPPGFLAHLPGYLARTVIVLVTLWAMQFTTVRDGGSIGVEDYRQCVAGAQADQFPGFCVYKTAEVRGDPLKQTFILSLSNGSILRARRIEPVSVGRTTSSERNTPATWALAAVTLIAVFFRTVRKAAGRILVKISPRIFGEREIFLPPCLQWLALLVLIAGAAAYVYPSLVEAIAMHRINAMEERVHDNPAAAGQTFVSKTEDGALYLLGSEGLDRVLKEAGYGCRFYTDEGVPVALASLKPGMPTQRSALPPGYRTAGTCLLPEYGGVKATSPN